MKIRYVISLLLALILLAGCGPSTTSTEVTAPEANVKKTIVDNQHKGEENVPGNDEDLPPEPTTPDTITSTTKEFVIKGSNFKFDISEITVKKGDTIKIIFENVEGRHNIFVEDYDVRTPVTSGPATDSITFIADTVGTFAYWCEVGTHRQLGMEGTLIVE